MKNKTTVSLFLVMLFGISTTAIAQQKTSIDSIITHNQSLFIIESDSLSSPIATAVGSNVINGDYAGITVTPYAVNFSNLSSFQVCALTGAKVSEGRGFSADISQLSDGAYVVRVQPAMIIPIIKQSGSVGFRMPSGSVALDDQPSHKHRSASSVPQINGDTGNWFYMARIEDVTTGEYYDNDIQQFPIPHYQPYTTPNANMQARFKGDTMGIVCPANNWGAKRFNSLTLYQYDSVTQTHYWLGIPMDVSVVSVILPDTVMDGILLDVNDGGSNHIQLTMVRQYIPSHVVSCLAQNPTWKPSTGEEYVKWIANTFPIPQDSFQLALNNTTAAHVTVPMLNGVYRNNKCAHERAGDFGYSLDSLIYDYGHTDTGGICGEHALFAQRTGHELYGLTVENSSIADTLPDGDGHAQVIYEIGDSITGITKLYLLDPTTNMLPLDSLGRPVDLETQLYLASQGRQREMHYSENTALAPHLGLGPCEFLSAGTNIPGVSRVEKPLPGKKLSRYYAVTDMRSLAQQQCYQEISAEWQKVASEKGYTIPLYTGDFQDFTMSPLWLYSVSKAYGSRIWNRVNAALITARGVGLKN